MSVADATFTEKDFYLAEFRGRSLGIALPSALPEDVAALAEVVRGLAGNDTRVVLLAPPTAALERLTPQIVDQHADTAWAGRLWRSLGEDGVAAVRLPAEEFASACGEAVIRLRLAKLVWLDPGGAIRGADGRRISALALPDLEARKTALADAAGAVPLSEIRRMLTAGVTSVSVCRAEELAQELFTYAGAGTFFSRDRYTDVRRLTLDDFDAAARLLAQGLAEGYLAPRSEGDVEALLSHGFGVFIEGRYLAGIGSLRPYPDAAAGEIAGLYTVTRFAGEGVGGHLIRFAIEQAAGAGLSRVFACTTADRVEQFFLRQGFARIDPDDVPRAKWDDYPASRREKLRCLGCAVE